MKLLTKLIEKGGLASLAATPATGATQDQVIAETVAKVAAQLDGPVAQPTTLTAEDAAAIWLWLAQIGEKDPEIIAQVLDQCRSDPDARRYFIRRANGFSI